jgi:hypothetical protein
MVDASTAKLSSMHFHGWQLGLKTGFLDLLKSFFFWGGFPIDTSTIWGFSWPPWANPRFILLEDQGSSRCH